MTSHDDMYLPWDQIEEHLFNESTGRLRLAEDCTEVKPIYLS